MDKNERYIKRNTNNHAPFITKRVKGKPSPWITNNIKQEMNTRDQLMRKERKTNNEADWLAYKRKRNFVKNEVQRSKRSHFKTKLRENSSKPDLEGFNEIFPTKNKGEKLPSNLSVNDSITNDKNKISNGFCKFFSTIASSL
jgi:ribulose kinase